METKKKPHNHDIAKRQLFHNGGKEDQGYEKERHLGAFFTRLNLACNRNDGCAKQTFLICSTFADCPFNGSLHLPSCWSICWSGVKKDTHWVEIKTHQQKKKKKQIRRSVAVKSRLYEESFFNNEAMETPQFLVQIEK